MSTVRGLTVLVSFALATPAVAKQQQGRQEIPDDLMSAYKKEFAFLEAQKRALHLRVKDLEVQGRQRIEQAEGAVNELQARLIALRGKADGEERALREAERLTPPEGEGDRVVETIDRARDTLARNGIQITKKTPVEIEQQETLLAEIFSRASRLILRQGRVRREQGVFFATDGVLVHGEVIRLGSVAAFGINERSSGALAPAGQGRLKLWHENAAATARQLAQGRTPQWLDVFLFESLDKGISPKQDQSLAQLIQAGGVVAYIIVGLGGVALLLVLARVTLLLLTWIQARGLLARLQPLVTRKKLEEACTLCRKTGGPLARVLEVTAQHLDAPQQMRDDRISEVMLQEGALLSRFSSAILVLAAIAPLLGLLGTVTGMISTFDIITEYGTGDPKILSAGISEALITTELGLIVAIPTLLIGTLLSGWGRTLEGRLERAALRLISHREQETTPARVEKEDSMIISRPATEAG